LIKNLRVNTKVYHESVNTVEDLCAVLNLCAAQNQGTRQRTHIRFIHIVSHGDKEGFLLWKAGGRDLTPEQLGAEFRRVKNAGIDAVFLSSCKSAQGQQMATAIMQKAGIPYVVGYWNNAYDSRCCLADQLFYYQVLFARSGDPHIEMAVRRVNDVLLLAGEKPARMLGCWHFDGENVYGPFPWSPEGWTHYESLEARSLLFKAIKRARFPIGPGTKNYLALRTLVESLDN